MSLIEQWQDGSRGLIFCEVLCRGHGLLGPTSRTFAFFTVVRPITCQSCTCDPSLYNDRNSSDHLIEYVSPALRRGVYVLFRSGILSPRNGRGAMG